MKCYLHYPREGQTIVINGVQFIEGVADMPKLHTYFERYYNVKDYPPQVPEIDKSIKEEFHFNEDDYKPSETGFIMDNVEASKGPSDQALLRMVVEAKKSEIEAKSNTIEATSATGPSLVEQYLALDNQGKRIGFVKEHTGKVIRGKDEAVAYLTQLDKQSGFN